MPHNSYILVRRFWAPLAWGPNNFSPSMIWSWQTRSNSRIGLGAELLLSAKSAFCFCCLFFFSSKSSCLSSFYLILFLLRNYAIIARWRWTLNFKRNRQVSWEEGAVSIIFSNREIFLNGVPLNSVVNSLCKDCRFCQGLQKLWKIFRANGIPSHLERSSRAFMTTLPTVLVMVISDLKSTLVSDVGVSCPHCFSILL